MKYLNFQLHVVLSVLGCLAIDDRTLAQPIPQTTGPGLTNTQVSPGPTISITGGQLSGTNLFHSFEQFNLNSGETATFATQGANHVLARVMGGSPSVIDGILKTSSNASLYLMNPTGILFGKNAVVNIQGSLVATTAHGIGFDNDRWFNALGNNDYVNLDTRSPRILGFNGPSGAIVNSGQLSAEGYNAQVVLVGSTVVNTGNLEAKGNVKRIAIATVSGAKTVRFGLDSSYILTLEVAAPSTIMPQDWTLPMSDLPGLLTGGNAALVTNVVKNTDGTVSLQGQPKPILAGDLAAGDITVPRGSIALTAYRDLTTGRINTFPSSDFNGGLSDSLGEQIHLTSETGNILSRSLHAGVSSIQVKTPGTFRVYGTTNGIDIKNADKTMYLSLNDNPELKNYLVSLGVPLEKLESASSGGGKTYIAVSYQSKGNISSYGYGDGSFSAKVPLATVNLEENIGVKPFYTGGLSPDYSVKTGNPPTDFDPTRNQGPDPTLANPLISTLPSDSNIQKFTLQRSYIPLNEFPEGISGSPVGVIRIQGSNIILIGSTTPRPFIPPTKSPPPSDNQPPPIAPPPPGGQQPPPPGGNQPENSTGQTAAAAGTALNRQKSTKPCIQSKQSTSSNCSNDQKSEAAILKILER